MSHDTEILSSSVRVALASYAHLTGMDNRKMAACLGVSEAYMSNVMNGNKGVSLIMLLKCRKVLGLDVNALIDGKTPATRATKTTLKKK